MGGFPAGGQCECLLLEDHRVPSLRDEGRLVQRVRISWLKACRVCSGTVLQVTRP